jgi:hypothetical protein
MNVFREKVPAAAGKNVLIKFEGEVLDPKETVKTLELEDEEMLDVEIV